MTTVAILYGKKVHSPRTVPSAENAPLGARFDAIGPISVSVEYVLAGRRKRTGTSRTERAHAARAAPWNLEPGGNGYRPLPVFIVVMRSLRSVGAETLIRSLSLDLNRSIPSTHVLQASQPERWFSSRLLSSSDSSPEM